MKVRRPWKLANAFPLWSRASATAQSWPDKRLVWIVALAGCLVVNFGVVAGAVYVGRLLWA